MNTNSQNKQRDTIPTKADIFQILNSYFDHIYLVTLKRSRDRHKLFEETLRGLNYQIFWGIDGRILDLEKLQESGLYDAELSKKKIPIGIELKRGELGCALSHINIYKEIIEKNYDKVLILEDDVKVDPIPIEVLESSLKELPASWDLFYLGYLYNNDRLQLPIYVRIYFAYPILSLLGYTRYDARKLRCKFPRPYSEHLQLAGFHYGTHAYAVTRSGAEKILRYLTPISLATDNALGVMCMEEKLLAFRSKRRIFHQNRDMPSTIKNSQ